MPHADKPVWRGIGQRPDQDCVDDAEDSRSRADPERQRQDRGEREAWARANHPQRHAKIVSEPFEPADVVHLVRLLTNAQRTAELLSCRQPCLVKGHPFGAKVIDAFRDVEIELATELTIDAPAAKRAQDTP
jgi:hypothetical protein